MLEFLPVLLIASSWLYSVWSTRTTGWNLWFAIPVLFFSSCSCLAERPTFVLASASVAFWFAWAWMNAIEVNSAKTTTTSATGYWALSDLLLWNAWGYLTAILPELPLSDWSSEAILSTSPATVAASGAAAFMIFGALVLRVGLFPGSQWLKACTAPSCATVLCSVVFPLWLVLAWRFAPLFAAAPAAADLTAKLAVLSAVVLGALACFSQRPGRPAEEARYRLILAAVGWLGLIWSGLFSLSLSLQLTVLGCTLVCLLGLAALMQRQLWGTYLIFAVLPALALTSAGSVAGSTDNSLVTGGLHKLGLTLVWAGYFRALPNWRLQGWRYLILAMVAGGWYLLFPESVVVLLLMVVGASVAHYLESTPTISGETSTWRRLIDQEFYLDEILNSAVMWPLHSLLLVLHWLAAALWDSAIAIEGVVYRRIEETLAAIDSPDGSRVYAELFLGTVFVLLLALWAA